MYSYGTIIKLRILRKHIVNFVHFEKESKYPIVIIYTQTNASKTFERHEIDIQKMSIKIICAIRVVTSLEF